MIRPWKPEDAEASYAVYVDAVRNGAARHYDKAQRAAWVPSETIEPWWTSRLADETAWVAEDAEGLTGLIALRQDGYLDLFFTRPRARGNGTASRLYDTLLEEAGRSGLRRLRTHASHFLRPFLERRGWQVIAPEDVHRFGVAMRRFEMALDHVPESQAS